MSQLNSFNNKFLPPVSYSMSTGEEALVWQAFINSEEPTKLGVNHVLLLARKYNKTFNSKGNDESSAEPNFWDTHILSKTEHWKKIYLSVDYCLINVKQLVNT